MAPSRLLRWATGSASGDSTPSAAQSRGRTGYHRHTSDSLQPCIGPERDHHARHPQRHPPFSPLGVPSRGCDLIGGSGDPRAPPARPLRRHGRPGAHPADDPAAGSPLRGPGGPAGRRGLGAPALPGAARCGRNPSAGQAQAAAVAERREAPAAAVAAADGSASGLVLRLRRKAGAAAGPGWHERALGGSRQGAGHTGWRASGGFFAAPGTDGAAGVAARHGTTHGSARAPCGPTRRSSGRPDSTPGSVLENAGRPGRPRPEPGHFRHHAG